MTKRKILAISVLNFFLWLSISLHIETVGIIAGLILVIILIDHLVFTLIDYILEFLENGE